MEARLQLAYAASTLKDLERAGWVLRGVKLPESVADHTFGTALLCLLYADEAGVDLERSVTIALVHDLAEALTGDVVARADPEDREISEAEKAAAERLAMQRLPGSEAVIEHWLEYEDRSTREATFVRDMNLIDMCLQALRYETEGRYDPGRPVASSGSFVHLDEFYASAQPRLSTQVGKRLFSSLKSAYAAVRAASS